MKRIVLPCFIVIELIIYVLFLSLDLGIVNDTFFQIVVTSNQIKFGGIIVCFLYAGYLVHQINNQDSKLIALAMFFTLLSDVFLLLREEYTVGIVTFCIVQSIYWYRINQKQWPRDFHVLLMEGIVLLVLSIARIEITVVLLVSTVYFILIVRNVIMAFIKRDNILFSVGLLLFLLCDINVGIFNLSGVVETSNGFYDGLYSFASIAMWLFYLPSQVCIVSSVKIEEKP